MRKIKHNLFTIIFFSLLTVMVSGHGATAEESYRVLVLPFNVHSVEDLSFLKQGVEDMLNTRLSLKEKVVLIDRGIAHQAIKGLEGALDEQAAVSLGSKLEADYVIFGSLTVFGDSISTDARLVDVKQKTPLIVFNKAGSSHGDLIQHIDLFAGQVNERLFGRKPEAPSPAAPAGKAPDIHAHPEKLWTGDVRMGEEDGMGADGSARLATTLWKSRSFNFEINGLAMGDTNGDGQNETVFISKNKVLIYRYAGNRFGRFQEFEGGKLDRFIGVDVGDINGNGRSEIFITNHTENQKLQSFVLEWNGNTFSKIAEGQSWYYRVVKVPDRGVHLYGQRRGIGDAEIVRPGIYELIWENGQYIDMEKQPLPKDAMAFGFAYGDILNNGEEFVAVFSKSDHLRILDKGGKEEWKSAEPLGGGSMYIEFPEEMDQHAGGIDRAYLPQRIQVADLDSDGKNEVVVVNNRDASGRVLTRTRLYKNGYVACLSWEAVGLYPKWRTRKISGFISDVAVNDFDGDGKDDIVFAVVAKGGMLSVNEKSYIVSWKIDS